MDNSSAAYDAWHGEHVTGDGPWYDLVKTALNGRLLAGARVLEIGCGGGTFAAWLADHGAAEVVAQDFSAVAISRALERCQHDNLTFAVGNIEAINAPAESFDLAVSCETIEHVPHPAKAISELARVLRPGGTLLLTTPNYMSISGLHRVFREATGRKWDEGGQPIAHWTLLPRTKRWCRQSGFAIQRVTGEGWYVPMRGRGSFAWTPPERCRSAFVPVAIHQLIEARRPVH